MGTAPGLWDIKPTSIHPTCPGPTIQGVAVNSILTQHFLRVSPDWVRKVINVLMGALVTLFVAFFSSYRALVATLLLTGAYVMLNGLILFDYGNWIVPAAGALTAAGLVWGILTLYRYIFESAERTRITKRFSGYVDPALVNYLVENPEARLDGELKEMTVVFTDLAGFTSISRPSSPTEKARLPRPLRPLQPSLRGAHLEPPYRSLGRTTGTKIASGVR